MLLIYSLAGGWLFGKHRNFTDTRNEPQTHPFVFYRRNPLILIHAKIDECAVYPTFFFTGSTRSYLKTKVDAAMIKK
jgi:hypothetical protein